VPIGPALAGARTKAGMSVEDVSERTRIRRTIVSEIERDDYSSCGGDFYARGHIRAIAKVVGTDPAPLIEQYDDDLAAREQAAALTGPDPKDWLDADSGARSLLGQLPPAGRGGGSGGRAAGGPDTAPQPGVPAGVPAELKHPAGPRSRALGVGAGGLATPAIRNAAADARRIGAEAAQQAGTWLREGGTWLREAGTAAFERFTRVRTGEELPSRIIGALAIFLAALIAVLYGIFSGPARSAPRPAVSPTHSTTHRTPATGRSASSRPRNSAPAASAAAQIRPARAFAFGPGGLADGDNPQLAGRAIKARPGAGWNTNWYTTAEFGGLQAGTGLLLDLGRPATVTGVTIRLGPAAGALLQLRAGNAAVSSGLPVVAQARGGGGAITLSPPEPVQARYLLIWFTRLPRDGTGTYQATVYHVSVTGRPART
jgi:cytoskeleton protein RodZ